MSKSLRASTVRLALVGAVVVLAARRHGGRRRSRVAARHRPAPGGPPALLHRLRPELQDPAGVRLIDQFSPNGFVPAIVNPAVVHCNPVEKILPTGQVFPITNPNAHLACFNIKPPSTQPTPTVQVTNQFGTGTLIPGQPNLLCVPSWKSLTGPPGMKPAHAAPAQPLHLLPGAAGPWHAPL